MIFRLGWLIDKVRSCHELLPGRPSSGLIMQQKSEMLGFRSFNKNTNPVAMVLRAVHKRC